MSRIKKKEILKLKAPWLRLKKEETVKSLSQFLHEVKSVKNAEGVLADFEYYFSDELCPPNSDA